MHLLLSVNSILDQTTKSNISLNGYAAKYNLSSLLVLLVFLFVKKDTGVISIKLSYQIQ